MFRINSSWPGFDKDIKVLKKIFEKNEYLPRQISQTIKNYLNKKHENSVKDQRTTTSDKRFYKLPFVGSFSTLTQNK